MILFPSLDCATQQICIVCKITCSRLFDKKKYVFNFDAMVRSCMSKNSYQQHVKNRPAFWTSFKKPVMILTWMIVTRVAQWARITQTSQITFTKTKVLLNKVFNSAKQNHLQSFTKTGQGQTVISAQPRQLYSTTSTKVKPIVIPKI